MVIFFALFVLKQLNIATMQNHEFGNQTIAMHCFAVKIRLIQEHDFLALSLESLKRPRKPTAEKSKSENPRRKRPIVGKYGIQSTNEMAFKRTVTLRASFRFPAIRFDPSTLLSFSGFAHAHAKCPPVGCGKLSLYPNDSCDEHAIYFRR